MRINVDIYLTESFSYNTTLNVASKDLKEFGLFEAVRKTFVKECGITYHKILINVSSKKNK